ncbi:phage tail assembly protein [Nocardia sp. GCM10030253]|uniref:phage tail assembly protein n=1 Tax=Nocardia sp. GCM10030253 TaxID=3273404 RepID=UPI003643D2F2
MTAASTTEFRFELPRGYVDLEGVVHRTGMMRRATPQDELAPVDKQRMRDNPGYFAVVLIAPVITKLGTLDSVGAGVIECLYAEDLAYLEDMYKRINGPISMRD